MQTKDITNAGLRVHRNICRLYEKVVESKISDLKNGFEYNIQLLKTVYGDFGLHDMICVYDNIFHLDKSTRNLAVNRKQIKEIEGNYHEGW